MTDPVTKENLQLALTQNIGVTGDVSFAVDRRRTGAAGADRHPDRRSRFVRTGDVEPHRLSQRHALPDQAPLSARAGDRPAHERAVSSTPGPSTTSRCRPPARVEWDAARVPAWIDTEARRLWVDYGIVDTCEPCDKQVIEGITGGVTSVTASQITFHTITPLADTGGYEITAQVRSKYFDPQDRATSCRKPRPQGGQPGLHARSRSTTVKRRGGRAAVRVPARAGDAGRHAATRARDGSRPTRCACWWDGSQLEQSLGTLPGK